MFHNIDASLALFARSVGPAAGEQTTGVISKGIGGQRQGRDEDISVQEVVATRDDLLVDRVSPDVNANDGPKINAQILHPAVQQEPSVNRERGVLETPATPSPR